MPSDDIAEREMITHEPMHSTRSKQSTGSRGTSNAAALSWSELDGPCVSPVPMEREMDEKCQIEGQAEPLVPLLSREVQRIRNSERDEEDEVEGEIEPRPKRQASTGRGGSIASLAACSPIIDDSSSRSAMSSLRVGRNPRSGGGIAAGGVHVAWLKHHHPLARHLA